MIYRRETHSIRPEMAEQFTEFFEHHLLPIRLKHGASLAGRWMNEDHREVVALWEYPSREAYRRVEETVRQDPLFLQVQAALNELGDIFLESHEDFVEATGRYSPPRHIVSAAGYITNPVGEVLMVRADWRKDTEDLPGGQVEEGEEPVSALQREILEETGMEVQITSLSGVYFNATRGICNLTFRGVAVGGRLAPSVETPEVAFLQLDESNVGDYVTRPNCRVRVLDAIQGQTVPYEASYVRPYERLRRLD